MGKDLKNIIEGYKNLLNKDERVEKVSKVRMEICNDCDKNSRSLVPYCKECGCVLSAKTRSMDSECPLKKW